MERWPPALQERMTYIQDFAKHGFMDLEESTPFETMAAPSFIIISVESHQNIFGGVTPLMVLFWTRALTEFPQWMPSMHELPQIILQNGIIQEVSRGTRKECFDRFEADLQTLPLAGLSRFNPTPWPS